MIPAKNRERKCSTCKHYQPSPLWRKGWCRNPLLYDRNTNHLVEADSLACNRTFIDYWEPNEGPQAAPGPQPKGTRPRIAPSIPMNTKDAQGRAGVVTGNTPAVGMPAVNPRQLYRPASGRGRAPLSIVTPDFEDEDGLDSANETEQLEQVAPVQQTAKQRIQQARAQRKPNLLGLSGVRLWTALGVLAFVVLLGAGAILMRNRPNVAPVVVPTVTVTLPLPSPTGFGDPTATVPAAQATTGTVPTDVIAVGGWVQVSSSGGLSVREEPSTTGKRITVLANGTKAHVVDGPRTANGLTWWKVDQFSTKDDTLTGWCAESFLSPTTAP